MAGAATCKLETDEALASTSMVGLPREKDFALFQAGNLVFLFILKWLS